MKRCRYCGEVLVIEPGPHRAYREKRAQHCNRHCYKLFLVACPPPATREWEPSEEQKAEWKSRQEEIWQRNFGHLVYAGED